MHAQSALKPVFLSLFGIAALAGCGSTPDAADETGKISQASITPCPNCIPPLGPPITLITPTLDVGSVAEEGDPENGVRTASAYVIVPSTGFLQASIPNAYGEWKVVNVVNLERASAPVITTSSTGVPVYTVPVTAGNEVRIDVQFTVSAATPLGSLSTSISIWNALSFAAVKLTSDSTTYPPNTPVFFFTQLDECAHTGPGGYFQLGDTTSTCTGFATNYAQTGFSVTNRGTGAGKVEFAPTDLGVQEDEHILVTCTPAFPSSIAAGATFETICGLQATMPFAAATGVVVPFNIAANGLRGGQNFDVMVNVVPTPSTSGGGGGGGSSSSCTQSGTTCTPAAGTDDCLSGCETVCYTNNVPITVSCAPITGTYCTAPAASTPGCSTVCGPQAVLDCASSQ